MDKQKFLKYLNAEIDRMMLELNYLEEEDCESDLGGRLDGAFLIRNVVESGQFDE